MVFDTQEDSVLDREAQEHDSGLPCPKWSRNCQKANNVEDPETALTNIAWLGLRRLIQEETIVAENVLGNTSQGLTPLGLLVDNLEDLYYVCSTPEDNKSLEGQPNVVGAVLNPKRVGFTCDRDRTYVPLCN